MTTSRFSFHNLGIDLKILEVIDHLGFTVPTPIQRMAIPVAIAGKDVIGVAQTGTGKTLAFGISMIQQLALMKTKGLILVPTRELAIQVNETLEKLTPVFGFKTAVIIGGVNIYNQIKTLKKGPEIIIATPGRMNDLLKRNLVRLSEFKMLILDEADRMLDMGFLPQIEIIMKQIPRDRHTMLFSATIPQEIIKIAANYMSAPVQLEVAASGTAAETVTQELFIVARENKGALLGELLKQYTGQVLIFTRTKRGAAKVTKLLRKFEHKAAEIHSDRSQSQRKEALERFKEGRYRILIATDIASRGIDVTGIELVVNYDLPDDAENYVHRIGRTGRAGKKGHAISFATPEQGSEVKAIEKLMRKTIHVNTRSSVPLENFSSSHGKTGSADSHKRAGEHKMVRGTQKHSEPKQKEVITGVVPATAVTEQVKKISRTKYNTKSWQNYESRPYLGRERGSRDNADKNKMGTGAGSFENTRSTGTRRDYYSANKPGFRGNKPFKSEISSHNRDKFKATRGPRRPFRTDGKSFPRPAYNSETAKANEASRGEANGNSRSFSGKAPYQGEKRPFHGKSDFQGGKKQFHENKPYNKGPGGYHDAKPFHSEISSHSRFKKDDRTGSSNRFSKFGARKPYGGRDSGSTAYGEKRFSADRPKFHGPKTFGERNRDGNSNERHFDRSSSQGGKPFRGKSSFHGKSSSGGYKGKFPRSR